jgi:hypothetical protein
MEAPPRTLLAEGRALYVGQPVVAIVAETREQAQDAAELAIVEYEDLPCVTDAREAAKPEAPQIWPQAPGNVSAQSRIGERAGGRSSVFPCCACHAAFASQPAIDRNGARAALFDRSARERPHHALYAEPDTDRCARRPRLPRSAASRRTTA